jgi:hypothetical protein
MDLSSLPKYPAFRRLEPAGSGPQMRFRLSPRTSRILRDVALVMAITALLYGFRRAASTFQGPPSVSPRPPVAFERIQERYEKVKGLTRTEVEALLGPPSPQTWVPEFERDAEIVAARPHRYSKGPFVWERWVDPNDEGRWVAVMFDNGIARHIIEKGFSRNPSRSP